MKIRAVILDLYETLLELGPPPADASVRWYALWTSTLGYAPRLNLEAFAADAEKVVRRERAGVERLGIQHPAVSWRAAVREAVPELNRLDQGQLDEFLLRHAQIVRSTRLSPGADDCLRRLAAADLPVGLISNSEAYGPRELDFALDRVGLSQAMFRPDLCFWSFEHGFGKPNPHVYQIVTTRLRQENISPESILLVGVNEKEDLKPARSHGWKTWRLTSNGAESSAHSGDWEQLTVALRLG